MFDNLNYLAPAKTATFKLVGLVTPPAKEPIELDVVFSGQGTAFFNEFAKIKAPERGASLEDRCEYRERVGRVLARHAITGWRNVFDGGKEVPYSETACAALFSKLIRLKDAKGDPVGRWDLLDDLAPFVMTAGNFSESMPTAADLGKG